jgi:hypothetical protein
MNPIVKVATTSYIRGDYPTDGPLINQFKRLQYCASNDFVQKKKASNLPPCVPNIPMCRTKYEVLLLHGHLKSVHKFTFFSLYISYALELLLNIRILFYLNICPGVAVYSPFSAECGRVQPHRAIEYPHYSDTIDLLLLLNLIKGLNPSLNIPLECGKVIINGVSGVT